MPAKRSSRRSRPTSRHGDAIARRVGPSSKLRQVDDYVLSFVDNHGRQVGHEDYRGTDAGARAFFLKRLPKVMAEDGYVYGGYARVK
jgi:hypothetical protein